MTEVVESVWASGSPSIKEVTWLIWANRGCYGIKEDAYKMLSIVLPRQVIVMLTASFTVIYYSSDLLLLFLVLTPFPSKVNRLYWCAAPHLHLYHWHLIVKHAFLYYNGLQSTFAISSPNSWNFVCLNLNCLKLSVQQTLYCVFSWCPKALKQ